MSPDGESTTDSSTDTAHVQVRVSSGRPTQEELAAVIAVVSAAARGAVEAESTSQPTLWSSPTSMHRLAMPAPGTGVWEQIGRYR